MTPLAAHRRALELVEKATGPDDGIDTEIGRLVYGTHPAFPVYTAPVYTASLDAVIALVEREMPGANWTLHWVGGKWRPGYEASARVMMPYSGRNDDEDGKPCDKASHEKPALALLAAFLRARMAELEQEAVR